MYRYAAPFPIILIIISHFLHGLCNLASNPSRASEMSYIIRGITKHIRALDYRKNVKWVTAPLSSPEVKRAQNVPLFIEKLQTRPKWREVSTTEELLGRKSSGSGLVSREYGRRDPSR
jgi:hypothetical protein